MCCRVAYSVLVALVMTGWSAAADERQAPPKEPAATAQATTQEGTLVRATADKLVVRIGARGAREAEEKTFTLTSNARIMQGDRQLTVTELRPEMRVRITATGVTNNASRVEVLDKGR